MPIEPVVGTPPLEAAATYTPKDGVLQIDISEYAGYGGLIVANGGLEPNPESFFAKEYGFKVKISMSESETWSPLNNGRLAATATTTDALAVLGRQFEAVVPVQIGYSRGADMVVVDRGIASVNQLAGKVLGASQFNESEFFIRYLAQEAGLPVVVLRDLDSRPASSELGLVFYEDAFVACDAYEHELGRSAAAAERLRRLDAAHRRGRREIGRQSQGAGVEPQPAGRRRRTRGEPRLRARSIRTWCAASCTASSKATAACATSRPRTSASSPRRSAGAKTKRATSSRTCTWRTCRRTVAFFAGTIDSAGSFGGIFQSSVLAYGELLKNPTDAARFADTSALDALAKKGLYADQRIAIAPIKTASQASLEGDPLLSKDIRFFFEPNSAALDKDAKQNLDYLDTIKRFLQVSPGSTVVLRGHVDNARVNEFREQGGEQLVKSMALKAMELSRQRAIVGERGAARSLQGSRRLAHRRRSGAAGKSPAGPDSELNRRVEVQWFTLE